MAEINLIDILRVYGTTTINLKYKGIEINAMLDNRDNKTSVFLSGAEISSIDELEQNEIQERLSKIDFLNLDDFCSQHNINASNNFKNIVKLMTTSNEDEIKLRESSCGGYNSILV